RWIVTYGFLLFGLPLMAVFIIEECGLSGHYIGGATPSFSTTTRCATNVPCDAGVATTNTFLPAVRSVRAAGVNVTMGTLGGTVPSLLPPLYDSFRLRPLVP